MHENVPKSCKISLILYLFHKYLFVLKKSMYLLLVVCFVHLVFYTQNVFLRFCYKTVQTCYSLSTNTNLVQDQSYLYIHGCINMNTLVFHNSKFNITFYIHSIQFMWCKSYKDYSDVKFEYFNWFTISHLVLF